MAVQEQESIGTLVRSVLADTRELMREEFELMRVEVREEVARVRSAAVGLGTALVTAVVGIVLLAIAVASAIAYFAGWPAWTGYAIVAVLLLIVAFASLSYGRSQLTNFRALPETRATVKENLEWMQSKSVQR